MGLGLMDGMGSWFEQQRQIEEMKKQAEQFKQGNGLPPDIMQMNQMQANNMGGFGNHMGQFLLDKVGMSDQAYKPWEQGGVQKDRTPMTGGPQQMNGIGSLPSMNGGQKQGGIKKILSLLAMI